MHYNNNVYEYIFLADAYNLISRFCIHSIVSGKALNISSGSLLNFLMGHSVTICDMAWYGLPHLKFGVDTVLYLCIRYPHLLCHVRMRFRVVHSFLRKLCLGGLSVGSFR
jgi:hypothetical protein